MQRLPIIALILIAAVFLAGAVGDPGDRFSAYLTGADVRPQVDTNTKGRFSIRFNEEENEARVYLRVSNGVGITEAHLHCVLIFPTIPIPTLVTRIAVTLFGRHP